MQQPIEEDVDDGEREKDCEAGKIARETDVLHEHQPISGVEKYV